MSATETLHARSENPNPIIVKTQRNLFNRPCY